MRQFTSIALLGFFTLFLSCEEGEFIPADLAIELQFPIDNKRCEKGINLPGENAFEIQLQWQVVGAIDSFELFINGEKEENFEPSFDNEGSFYFFRRKFQYSAENYEWKIAGGNGSGEESPVFTFTTPARATNNNTAPYPVNFSNHSFSNNVLTVNWTTVDLDAEDNVSLVYDAYYYTDANVSTSTFGERKENLDVEQVQFEIPNFSPTQEYFVLIVARDNSGNESYSRSKFCQLCN